MTRTLHVTIEENADNSDLQETMATLAEGGNVEPEEPRLSFESLEAFGHVFRPTNLRLLQAIADHEPSSIRELARIVDRHPPDVTENVHELANCGLIELETNGRAKRPIVRYDDVDVDLPISAGDPDPARA